MKKRWGGEAQIRQMGGEKYNKGGKRNGTNRREGKGGDRGGVGGRVGAGMGVR